MFVEYRRDREAAASRTFTSTSQQRRKREKLACLMSLLVLVTRTHPSFDFVDAIALFFRTTRRHMTFFITCLRPIVIHTHTHMHRYLYIHINIYILHFRHVTFLRALDRRSAFNGKRKVEKRKETKE